MTGSQWGVEGSGRMLRPMRLLLFLLAIPLLANAQGAAPWQMEPSETTADLRGVHAVGGGVVWASGSGGTVLRSQDSGFEWQQCETPPGAEKLDFRGIWAWDDQTAVVMSSGPGALSRLYRTTDGCAHWTLLYTNAAPQGFWDGIAFSDRSNGYLLGDPVDGQLLLERTGDGGKTWTRVNSPELNVGERGAFAASNSSLMIVAPKPGVMNIPWIGTGGPGKALVLQGGINCTMGIAHSNPEECMRHLSFSRNLVPLTGATTSQGVFSLAVRTGDMGEIVGALAVGGDYSRPDERVGTAAYWSTTPQAENWHVPTTPPGGYRSAVAWDADLNVWITAGPNGSDLSRDDGKTWQRIERASVDAPKGGEWNALSLPWAVGPHGRIGKLNASALSTPAAAAR